MKEIIQRELDNLYLLIMHINKYNLLFCTRYDICTSRFDYNNLLNRLFTLKLWETRHDVNKTNKNRLLLCIIIIIIDTCIKVIDFYNAIWHN